MMPDNEISPVMLLGPKRAISGPMEPPRSNRIIADNWRGLYGSDLFSSIWRLVAMLVAIEALSSPFETANLRENIGILTGQYGGSDGCTLDDGTARH
jgi:hypothetical protein